MEQNLATELLHELKAQSKRWFIAFITVLILWFATIGVFIWYVSLPAENYSVEQESQDAGTNQIIGGDYNGETEDNN